MKRVVLVGNPNVGKTSVFNFVTGKQFRVGNFPGVTVEKRHTTFDFKGELYNFVDLPGMYSFMSRSLDEAISRDYLLLDQGDTPDIILNVVDANNLERNLYLTTSLLQLGKPVIVVVTMLDVAKNNALNLDLERLSNNLGVPVMGLVNKDRWEKEQLLQMIQEVPAFTQNVVFPTILYNTVQPLAEAIAKGGLKDFRDKSVFIAFKLLEEDKKLQQDFTHETEVLAVKAQVLKELHLLFYNDIILVLAQFRYNFIERVLRYVKITPGKTQTITKKIDSYLLHKYWGIPLFVFIIWFCFKFAVSIGNAFQDFFEITSGAVFVDFLGSVLQNHPLLKMIFANSIGPGIQSLATFVPVIFMVFVIMNLLEDTGYLARITVLIDRIMRFFGLPGKALAPLIMGFGCNVMSIFGSRVLETPQERKISVAMSPFISCGARLPVYTLITLAIFPNNQGVVIASLYIVGILFSILTAAIVKRVFFPSYANSFLFLDMPEYHIPNIKMILKLSWRRVKSLMMRAFKLLVIFMALYQILDHITLIHPKEGFIVQDSESSVIRSFGEALTKPLSYMGMKPDNWPMSVALINGLLAKESVVGTLVVAFAAEDKKNTPQDASSEPQKKQDIHWREVGTQFLSSMKEAVVSIPHNLIGYHEDGKWQEGVLTSPEFYIPFYSVVHNTEDLDEDATGIVGKIQSSFLDHHIQDVHKRKLAGKIAAYAYLLFILLYTACIAVLSATNKELGSKWMWGILVYQLMLAYIVSVIFYQVGMRIIS